jgi:imidazolonepropionase-like amidohydrolase
MPILLKSGQLIDGTGRPPVREAHIVVNGDRIAAVGRADEMPVPPGADMIDLSRATVLPGLIDCHTHLMLGFGDDPDERYPQPELYQMLKCVPHMRTDLRCGITTIRNPSERSFRAAAVRHAIDQGLISGPRIVAGMRGIRATHGWGQNAYGFDGIDALRRAIRENVEAGADLIKIYATGENFRNTALTSYFSREEIHVCVEEAHRAGLRVAAHAHGGQGLRDCVETGVDTIEHATRITEADIELFLKHDTTLVATFNPYLHESTLVPGRPPAFVAGVTAAQENMRCVFPTALRSGMKFTVGSDSRHGNFVFELETLVAFGLSPLEAISACTRQAAEALGLLDATGTIAPGKWADIIAVPEDPTVEISRLRHVSFVMKGGVILELSER